MFLIKTKHNKNLIQTLAAHQLSSLYSKATIVVIKQWAHTILSHIDGLVQDGSISIANALEIPKSCMSPQHNINGLAQDCCNSIAETPELSQSCTKQMKCQFTASKFNL